MLSSAQEKNYEFFTKNLPDYLNNPITKGKFAVFCDEELKGVYDTFEVAYEDACSKFQVGEFIIQQIIDSSDVVEFIWSAVV